MHAKAHVARLLVAAFLGALLGGGAAGWIMLRSHVPAYWEMRGESGAAEPGPVAEAVRAVGPCVVRVDFETERPELSLEFDIGREVPRALNVASGVVLDAARGCIVTNAHLLEKTRGIWVTIPGKGRYAARLLGSDPLTDIAVLSITAHGLRQAKLGSGRAQPVGSWVIAIGNPLGFEKTVTVGVVSAKGRQLGRDSGFPLEDLIQTDAAINEGNSGGALANLRGAVIGICTTAFPQSAAHGLGFAVTADKVKEVAPVLISRGRIVRAWLGVWLSRVNPEETRELGLPAGVQAGALIERVEPGSPAARARLSKSDVVTAAGGRKIDSPEALQAAVRQHRPGEKLNISIRRGSRSLPVTVVLSEMPSKPRE
jgi:serine protease Do